jgi:organic radical activating enzyme
LKINKKGENMGLYTHYLKNGILIEQFLTKKCNFECAHCMYNCSPRSSNDFVSDVELSKLKKQVDFLQSLGIHVTINLLGGEPTLFFDKLKHVVDLVASWNVGISMPTNGWWLEKEKNTDRFFDIFEKHLAYNNSRKDSNNGNGLCIWISSEKYHSQFQKGNNNKQYFDNLFNSKKYRYLLPDYEKPWIFWQILGDNYYINPKGRGEGISNALQYIQRYEYENSNFCWNEFNFYALKATSQTDNIHYELDGSISDTCMFGSDYRGIGNVDDNILYVIALLNKYRVWRQHIGGYNCYNCRTMFERWMKEEMPKAKEELIGFNNFEVGFWKQIISKEE